CNPGGIKMPLATSPRPINIGGTVHPGIEFFSTRRNSYETDSFRTPVAGSSPQTNKHAPAPSDVPFFHFSKGVLSPGKCQGKGVPTLRRIEALRSRGPSRPAKDKAQASQPGGNSVILVSSGSRARPRPLGQ